MTINLSGRSAKKVYLRELRDSLNASEKLVENLNRMSEESLTELAITVRELKKNQTQPVDPTEIIDPPPLSSIIANEEKPTEVVSNG